MKIIISLRVQYENIITKDGPGRNFTCQITNLLSTGASGIIIFDAYRSPPAVYVANTVYYSSNNIPWLRACRKDVVTYAAATSVTLRVEIPKSYFTGHQRDNTKRARDDYAVRSEETTAFHREDEERRIINAYTTLAVLSSSSVREEDDFGFGREKMKRRDRRDNERIVLSNERTMK